MATALNPKQLRFVAEWMKHGNASRAYALAGYQPQTQRSLEVASSRLLSHVEVQREITRRKAAMIKRADVTLDKLLQDLQDDRALARKLEQPSAAIAATQLTAKLCGLLIERKESGAPGDFAGAKTEAEVVDQVRTELGDAAANLLISLVKAVADPLVDAPPASDAIN